MRQKRLHKTKMKEIITIINEKGGVAKSTTALNLAVALRNKGKRAIIIDLDPQKSLSKGIGVATEEEPALTIADVLYDDTDSVNIKDAVIHTDFIDLISGSSTLANFDAVMYEVPGKELRLRELLKGLYDDYEYIIIDTPPQRSTLTISALTACTDVIIPVMADQGSLDSTDELGRTIAKIRKYTNPGLRVRGILYTRVNPQTVLLQVLKEDAAKYAERLNSKVFNTSIRATIAVGEANRMRVDLFTYDRNSTASHDYISFVNEYLADSDKL